MSFVASIQTGYERVWGVESAPWHATWRREIALAVLIGYMLAAANSGVPHGIAMSSPWWKPCRWAQRGSGE